MFGLFHNTVYVRVTPEQLSVLHVESGKEVADVPVLAIDKTKGKSSIIAVGRQATIKAGLPNITVANGFEHPRTLIADFAIAEQTLKQFLKMVLPRNLFTPSPIIVIHPLNSLEGGLTQIEIRALAEMGHGAGGRKVYVWTGPVLSKTDLQTLQFSQAGGGQLLYP